MRTVYLEPVTFECHVVQNTEGTRIPCETDFFDGKCDTFIEGYRFVPSGESWTRSDGVVFTGDMIAPWKNCALLEAAQEQYETMLSEMDAAYQEGVNSV